MNTIAILLLCAKLAIDIALGSKALKEARLGREELKSLKEAVMQRFDNHEARLDMLERDSGVN